MSESNHEYRLNCNWKDFSVIPVDIRSDFHQLPIQNSSMANQFSILISPFNFQCICQGCFRLQMELRSHARKLVEAEAGRAAAEAERARLETEVSEL